MAAGDLYRDIHGDVHIGRPAWISAGRPIYRQAGLYIGPMTPAMYQGAVD